VAVWEDHLLPKLTCKEAARLECTCKALKEMVRGHFREDVGAINLRQLRAALTTFPRAREVTLSDQGISRTIAEWRALVEWLREGGRGRHLAIMRSDGGSVASLVVHTALRQGALPSLRGLDADLAHAYPRASLTGGLLRSMHELHLKVALPHQAQPQFAALGLVRQLPALAKLKLQVCSDVTSGVHVPLLWPPFIPPSLKALSFMLKGGPWSLSLLRALPAMLEASGAGLERLEADIASSYVRALDGRLVHVAQVLRCCSLTLRVLDLAKSGAISILDDDQEDEHQSRLARLRVEWAGVMAGVSACRELEVLLLPRPEVETLFPPGTAFARLTRLEMSVHGRDRPPAGAMGVWEVMSSGGLPALAKLKVMLAGRWDEWQEEVRSRVAPALEAVAGTWTHLHLTGYTPGEAVGYELGVALGKLRRLKDLVLGLWHDGRAFHAVAQGLAASGGDRPLPLLWRVKVLSPVDTNSDLLASLLLPSVRVFVSFHHSGQAALLMACALRQAGYKHTWAPGLECPGEVLDAIRAMVECRFDETDVEEGPGNPASPDYSPGSDDEAFMLNQSCCISLSFALDRRTEVVQRL
jgi:hypothetical protein